MEKAKKLEIVKTGKSATGKSSYLRYLAGKKVTQIPAIEAKCYDCMGHYADGCRDCLMEDCPLYPWMPYRGKENTPVFEADAPLESPDRNFEGSGDSGVGVDDK